MEVAWEGRRVVRELSLGHGTTSQSDPRVHVGLGAWNKAARVTVRWPSGRRTRHALSGGLHVLEERD